MPTNSIAALQCDPCTLQFGEKNVTAVGMFDHFCFLFHL